MERTHAQFVLEVFEEERCFSLRGVAEGDDPDFIFSLGRRGFRKGKASPREELERG